VEGIVRAKHEVSVSLTLDQVSWLAGDVRMARREHAVRERAKGKRTSQFWTAFYDDLEKRLEAAEAAAKADEAVAEEAPA
jgi:hypothetical protein